MGQVLYAYLSGRRLAPSAGSKEVADLDGQTQAQPPIKISVRNLVEFVMRSGDLDNRSSLQFIDPKGHTLTQSQNDALVAVFQAAFSK